MKPRSCQCDRPVIKQASPTLITLIVIESKFLEGLGRLEMCGLGLNILKGAEKKRKKKSISVHRNPPCAASTRCLFSTSLNLIMSTNWINTPDAWGYY